MIQPWCSKINLKKYLECAVIQNNVKQWVLSESNKCQFQDEIAYSKLFVAYCNIKDVLYDNFCQSIFAYVKYVRIQ